MPPYQRVAFPQQFGPDPYVDYGRFLTAEGGILISYKDIDERLRHLLWGGLLWTMFTGLEAWLLTRFAPTLNGVVVFALLLVFAVFNWFIVSRPVEVYRKVEIRPDCMIIEGSEVFWASRMENGVPSFSPNEEGHFVLSGIYGSRFVEFLTIRRFDEFDRAPEVFAAHLIDAMRQLWMNGHGQ